MIAERLSSLAAVSMLFIFLSIIILTPVGRGDVLYYWGFNVSTNTWYIRPLYVNLGNVTTVILVNASVSKGSAYIPFYGELSHCISHYDNPVVFGNVTGVVGVKKFKSVADKLDALESIVESVAPAEHREVYKSVVRALKMLAEHGFSIPGSVALARMVDEDVWKAEQVNVSTPVRVGALIALMPELRVVEGGLFGELIPALLPSLLDPREVLAACGLSEYSSWKLVRTQFGLHTPYILDAVVVKTGNGVGVYLVELHSFRGSLLVKDRGNVVAGVYGDAYVAYSIEPGGGEGYRVAGLRCLGSYLEVVVQARNGTVLKRDRVNKTLALPVTVYGDGGYRVLLKDGAIVVKHDGRALTIPVYSIRGKFTTVKGRMPIGSILYIDEEHDNIIALVVGNDNNVIVLKSGSQSESTRRLFVYERGSPRTYPPRIFITPVDEDLDGVYDAVYLQADDGKNWIFALLVRLDGRPQRLLDTDGDRIIDAIVVDGVRKRVDLDKLPACKHLVILYRVGGEDVDLKRFISVLYTLYIRGYRDVVDYADKLWRSKGLRWLASRVYEAILSGGSFYPLPFIGKSRAITNDEYIRAAMGGVERLMSVLGVPMEPVLAWRDEFAVDTLLRVIASNLGIRVKNTHLLDSYAEFLGACGASVLKLVDDAGDPLCTCLTRVIYKEYNKKPHWIVGCGDCKWNVSDVSNPEFAEKVFAYSLVYACDRLAHRGGSVDPRGIEECAKRVVDAVGDRNVYVEKIRDALLEALRYYRLVSNETLVYEALRSWNETKEIADMLASLLVEHGCCSQSAVSYKIYDMLYRLRFRLRAALERGEATIVEARNAEYLAERLLQAIPDAEPCSLLRNRLKSLKDGIARASRLYWSKLDEEIAKMGCMHMSVEYRGDTIAVRCEDNGVEKLFPAEYAKQFLSRTITHRIVSGTVRYTLTAKTGVGGHGRSATAPTIIGAGGFADIRIVLVAAAIAAAAAALVLLKTRR